MTKEVISDDCIDQYSLMTSIRYSAHSDLTVPSPFLDLDVVLPVT